MVNGVWYTLGNTSCPECNVWYIVHRMWYVLYPASVRCRRPALVKQRQTHVGHRRTLKPCARAGVMLAVVAPPPRGVPWPRSRLRNAHTHKETSSRGTVLRKNALSRSPKQDRHGTTRGDTPGRGRGIGNNIGIVKLSTPSPPKALCQHRIHRRGLEPT